jgi:hypothetical protein
VKTFEFKIYVKVVLIMCERKLKLCDYGVKINIRLIELRRTNTWLVEEVKKAYTGHYFDSSILHKIKAGEVKSSGAIPIINDILGL